MLDTKKLRFIPEDEVPQRKRKIQWETIFNSIPKGQALVIQPNEVPASTVREALKRLQSRGKFKHLYMTTRKVGKNRYISYIVNPSKTE